MDGLTYMMVDGWIDIHEINKMNSVLPSKKEATIKSRWKLIFQSIGNLTLQCLVVTKRSHILKQICTFQLA